MESMFKKSLLSLLIIMIVALLVAVPTTVHAASFKASKNIAVKTIGESEDDDIINLEDEDMDEVDLEDEDMDEVDLEDEDMDEPDYEDEDMDEPDYEDEDIDEPDYEEMSDLPACTFANFANRIIYFGGATYSPFAFDMSKATPKGSCDEGTAGLVISVNSKNKTLVVASAALKGLRKIKYEQITGIREEKFLQLNKDGDNLLNLNIKFAGENTQLILENGLDGAYSTDGALSVGFENAFSKVTLVKNGENVAEFYIINDGCGNLSVAFGDGFNASADMEARFLDKLKLGGVVEFILDSTGTVNVAAAGRVQDNEIVRAEAEGAPEAGDYGIGGQVTILGHTIGDKSNKLPVVETVRKVVSVIKGLLGKLPIGM